jgi:hypothetical protein
LHQAATGDNESISVNPLDVFPADEDLDAPFEDESL